MLQNNSHFATMQSNRSTTHNPLSNTFAAQWQSEIGFAKHPLLYPENSQAHLQTDLYTQNSTQEAYASLSRSFFAKQKAEPAGAVDSFLTYDFQCLCFDSGPPASPSPPALQL